MRSAVRILLSSLTISFFLLSCQKEVSFEQGQKSLGSLQGAGGECLPKTVGGLYKAGTVLTDSNYIDVTVDITRTGSYTVSTDTINGYSFKGTGTITATGPATLRLRGIGTPVIAENNIFTVTFDSTSCDVSVTVTGGGGPTTGGSAVYTLTGAPGACGGAVFAGTYTQGTALTASNTLTLQVNVTTIGQWIVATNSVSGVSFNGIGNFTTTGTQTIVLTATGTPTASGNVALTVTAGTSMCTLSLSVNPGTTAPTSDDYFPRTAGSNWTYYFDGDLDDTLYQVATPQTLTIFGKTYTIFAVTDDVATNTYDSGGYFRRDAADYFELVNTQEFGFDTESRIDVPFLKSAQAVNSSWYSPSYTGGISGTPFTLREKFTNTQVNISVTVNGRVYTNVIVVERRLEAQGPVGGFQDVSATVGYVRASYARGVGLIKFETIRPGNPIQTVELKRSQIF